MTNRTFANEMDYEKVELLVLACGSLERLRFDSLNA